MRRSTRVLLVSLAASAALLLQADAATAAELDCTGSTATSTAGCNEQFAGLFWSTVQMQPSGTGFIDSFLRIQRNTLEEGMNSDFRPLELNEITDPNYTRDIQLGEIRQVTFDPDGDGPSGAITYYELLLDINEPDSNEKSLLTLVGLKLCTSSTGDQYDETGGSCDEGASAAVEQYNLDGTVDNQVKLDYSYLSTGSGGSDLFVYIPVSLLGTDPNTYLYLWSQFGWLDGDDWKSQDGFEEWAARIGTTDFPLPNPTLPEPASLFLLGSGLAVVAARFRRGRRRA